MTHQRHPAAQRRHIALATITALIAVTVAARPVLGAAAQRQREGDRGVADDRTSTSPHKSACESTTPTTTRSNTMMPRFISWLAIGIAGAFLVVATATFSLSAITWLAFAVSIGTLVVAAGLGYGYPRHTATLLTASAVAVVSAWTIVASQVFAATTVQNLALAGALAISGLAIVGLTEHELSTEHMLDRAVHETHTGEASLAAAA
jgi:hypothetical protein